jgi:peptide/nickel transport system substrate-binding protein
MLNNLAAVGIKAELRMGQYSAMRDALRKGETPIAFMTWGSNSVPDAEAFVPVFFGGQPDDLSKDETIINWLKATSSTINPDVRKEVFAKVLKRIADQAYWVPLWTYPTNYAVSKSLDFRPTSDEIPRYYEAKWK